MARITINDVARHAGVSKKTVSHVLNGVGAVSAATRERVQAAVADLGFTPSPQARALARGRSDLVFVVHDGGNAHEIASALAAAGPVLSEAGLAMAVLSLSGDDSSLSTTLERHRPLGVILLPRLEQRQRTVAEKAGCRVARVCDDETEGNALRTTPHLAAADATGYLLALGHHRIAFVGGPEGCSRAGAMERGFIEAVTGHAIELLATGDYGFASGMDAGRLLLELSPRPTAILAASDEMAAGVLMAAALAGIAVPQQLSVMGIGETLPGENLVPPLSTMRAPIDELARRAARQIVDPAGQPETQAPVHYALTPRGSTGPAPA